MESDCLSALAEQLRDARNASDCVLSEVSAALAVLASDGEGVRGGGCEAKCRIILILYNNKLCHCTNSHCAL